MSRPDSCKCRAESQTWADWKIFPCSKFFDSATGGRWCGRCGHVRACHAEKKAKYSDDGEMRDAVLAYITALRESRDAEREEKERLGRVIDKAPHAKSCPVFLLPGFAFVRVMPRECDCWKAKAPK